ncbi:MAG TPA: cbb3-type cytochrome c oxidase subunit II [Phycisphaerae bacterium]|nr:cbb3-type cytochrome c oxidase subunit II [Phycisphaerae bacterium]
MFESKAGVFFIAGVGFFALSFLVMAVLPWTIYAGEAEQTLEQMAERGIVPEFVDLAERYPEKFKQYFGEVSYASFVEALKLGHATYVAEACWHCHSQFVRPVSNEDLRWGPVSHALEYQNEMQRPVLFGTRRVGPDLSREAGVRTNDWHVAHFWKPTAVVPTSVMPSYRWFFDAEGYPNKRGMAIITYVQWLGSWIEEYPYFHGEGPTGPVEHEGAHPQGVKP